jgi:hypothetical protein
MKQKIFFAGTVLILAMAVAAKGADVAGKWITEQESPAGTQQTIYNFTVNGTTLNGTISGGRGGDAEISEGKIEGDEISFAVVRAMGESETKTLYRGKISGDEIKFTIERQGRAPGGGGAAKVGPGGGQRGGGGQGAGQGAPKSKPEGGQRGGGGPQELTAKRAK